MPTLVSTLDEFTEVLEKNPNKLVLVDFFAEWCGPCKRIAPAFSKLTTVFPNLVCLKVDVDDPDSEEIVVKYSVSAMPTFVYLKNGEEVAKLKGADLKSLTDLIQTHYVPPPKEDEVDADNDAGNDADNNVSNDNENPDGESKTDD